MFDSPGPLVPTYENCFVQGPQDALILVQAVINGRLTAVERRPQDQERNKLIKSGNVFIFDETRGHIQRWTDGISWSPSRILGEFLIYREKKQGQRSSQGSSTYPKKSTSSVGCGHDAKQSANGNGVTKKPVPSRHQRLSSSLDRTGSMMMPSMMSSQYPSYIGGNSQVLYSSQPLTSPSSRNQSAEYNLYGSLTSNEQYKENGLIKKTISIPYKNSSYRLVSYYFPEDVEANRLLIPTQDPRFSDISVDSQLAEKKNLKVSIPINHQDIMMSLSYNQRLSMGQMDPYNHFGTLTAPPTAPPLGNHAIGQQIYKATLPHPGQMYDRTDLLYPQNGVPQNVDRMQHPSSADATEGYPYHNFDPNFSQGTGSDGYMDMAVYANPTNTEDVSSRGHYHPELYSKYQEKLSRPSSIHQGPSNPGQHVQSSHNTTETVSPSSRTSQNFDGQWDYGNEPLTEGTAPDYSICNQTQSSLGSPSGSKMPFANPGTYNQLHRSNPLEHDTISAQDVKFEKLSQPNLIKMDMQNGGTDPLQDEMFGPVSPAHNDPLCGSVGQPGGISASVISQDSDGYEPRYGSTSPPSDCHLNEMATLPKELGERHDVNKHEHIEIPEDSNRLQSGSQHAYISTATTAPYGIHLF